MKPFYTFFRGLMYLPYKLVFPTTVVGRENMPKTKRIISVSNHLSILDIPTIAIYVPGYRHYLAKKEIGNKKAILKLGLALGVIFIDREKTDMRALRECVNLLKAGDGLAIFPEGTRNKHNTELQEIKGGVTLIAVKGQSPLVPIMMYSRSKIFKRNYLYIGKPFDLSEFSNKQLDSQTLENASKVVKSHMQEAKNYIDDYVQFKRWKEIRKQKKLYKKELNVLNSAAKKSYKLAVKALKKPTKI